MPWTPPATDQPSTTWKPPASDKLAADQEDPLILDLQNPGWRGTIPKFAAGVAQGAALDPIEKLGELTGIGQNVPDWLEKRLQGLRTAAGTTTPGEVGRVMGTFANPLWRFLPKIPVTEFAGPTARALAKLGTSIYQGAVGGAAQPTGAKTPAEAAKQTVPQLAAGGAIGGALGAPGAAAAQAGYESLQQPIREVLRDLPLEFRRIERLRNLSRPAFTRWWHEQSVAPIGGKVPGVASKATMDNISMQIGGALDAATRNMTFDATNPAVRQALTNTRVNSMLNLATSGDAAAAYKDTLDRLVINPLVVNGGKLDSKGLQTITSNLDAHIRAINPGTSPDQALLKRELENFRMSILDNASGTPAEKQAYTRARQAWRIHATGRDSQPLGEPHGHIDPDQVARELDRRDPLRYPYGGGPRGAPDRIQAGVNAAQQALGNMRGAARRGAAGKPLRQPEDYAAPTAHAVAPALSYVWPDQQNQ